MAQKRMFSLSVVDTDQFLEMPLSSRLLYYELGMRADDDGFVANWKKILAFTGLKEDDMKILITKKYIIPFESGVIVIRHWRLNNYLQKDRTKPTIYQEELKQLETDNNNVYNMYTKCIHSIDKNSIDKNSIDKNSIDKNSIDKNSIEEIYSLAEQDKIPYKEIIDYLNFKTNSKYKYTTNKTKSLIKARYEEGFRLEDFKQVIDKKVIDWEKTEWEKFLRPNTLFGTNFENYLNQPIKKKTLKDITLKELEEMEDESNRVYNSN